MRGRTKMREREEWYIEKLRFKISIMVAIAQFMPYDLARCDCERKTCKDWVWSKMCWKCNQNVVQRWSIVSNYDTPESQICLGQSVDTSLVPSALFQIVVSES